MALGKPVLCYLRDDLVIADIDNCPILNVNPETLYNVLRECAKGAIDLADVGRRGRAFVERNYSVAAVAARLGKLYIQTAGFPDALASRLARRVAELERATI
jgi:hypothetical protein